MCMNHALGLEELMIVNPCPCGCSAPLYLGNDGTLYEVEGLGKGDEPEEPRQFFLGDDGLIYELVGLELENQKPTTVSCCGDKEDDYGQS